MIVIEAEGEEGAPFTEEIASVSQEDQEGAAGGFWFGGLPVSMSGLSHFCKLST